MSGMSFMSWFKRCHSLAAERYCAVGVDVSRRELVLGEEDIAVAVVVVECHCCFVWMMGVRFMVATYSIGLGLR